MMVGRHTPEGYGILRCCTWFLNSRNRLSLGIFLVCIGAVLLGVTNISLAIMSRHVNPLVAGYFWEISIGFASLILIVLRQAIFKKKIERIDFRTFLIIAACSLPTLIGTACFSLAFRLGSAAIVSAIGGGSLVIMALLGWWWYDEKVKTGQWASILLILAGIVALKFV